MQHTKNDKLACLFGIGFTLMGSFFTMFNYIEFKLVEPSYSLSTVIFGWSGVGLFMTGALASSFTLAAIVQVFTSIKAVHSEIAQ